MKIKTESDNWIIGLTKNAWTYIQENLQTILYLYAPMIFLSIMFIIVTRTQINTLLTNLSTDFLTIIITITYVNWAINRQEKLKWLKPNIFVSSEFGKFAHFFISTTAHDLNIEGKIFPEKIDTSPRKLQSTIINNTKSIDIEVIVKGIRTLDPNGWKILTSNIKNQTLKALDLISIFGGNLVPDQIEIMLRFREKAAFLLSRYDLLQDFAGVPISMMPKTKDGKQYETGELLIDETALDIMECLKISLEIIDKFKYQLPENLDNRTDDIKKIYDPFKLPI